MKRIVIMMIMAAIMGGCHKDNITGDTPPMPESNVTSYSGKLTLNIGQNVTKSFDENLVWSWEVGDIIYGYQDYGDKTLNKLTFKEGNTFECEEFVYSSKEPAKFCFFYGEVDNDGQYITAIQDGNWKPVLFGSIDNATLPDIGTVNMNHLSSAIEFQLFYAHEEDTPFNIKEAKLSSNKDIVGKWKATDYGAYRAQEGKGLTIALSEPSNAVVFNVLPISKIYGYDESATFTVEFTTVTDKIIEKSFNASMFGLAEGYCLTYKVDADVSVQLPSADDFNKIIKQNIGNCTKIDFIANSMPDNTSNKISVDGSEPIYFVQNNGTLEIHTPADKFQAPVSCNEMFANLSSVKNIYFNGVFDTSEVLSMEGMFKNCSSLQALDLSNFETENVTTMKSMFSGCSSLTKSLDLTGDFNTSKVTDMSYMFFNCISLSGNLLDLKNFSFDAITEIVQIFNFLLLETSYVTLMLSDEGAEWFEKNVVDYKFGQQWLGNNYRPSKTTDDGRPIVPILPT